MYIFQVVCLLLHSTQKEQTWTDTSDPNLSHLLDGHGEVQDLVVLEVLQSILLDDSHAHVWVAERLDAVPDAHDELVLLAHALHILSSVGTLVRPLKIENASMKIKFLPVIFPVRSLIFVTS